MTGMPMRMPASAAAAPAMTMDSSRRSIVDSTTPASAEAATTPVKAPTLMKPAWPSESSPDTPTTRLSEIAMQM